MGKKDEYITVFNERKRESQFVLSRGDRGRPAGELYNLVLRTLLRSRNFDLLEMSIRIYKYLYLTSQELTATDRMTIVFGSEFISDLEKLCKSERDTNIQFQFKNKWGKVMTEKLFIANLKEVFPICAKAATEARVEYLIELKAIIEKRKESMRIGAVK